MGEESIRRARRREKLRQLLADNGGAAEVARITGTPKSHFSAILAGRRGVGDELAKKLETVYGKTPGWFDRENAAQWPFSAELQEHVQQLRPPEIRSLESAMWVHLRLPLPKVLLLSDEADEARAGELISSVQRQRQDRELATHLSLRKDYPDSTKEGSAKKRYPALEEAARYAEDGNGSAQHQPAPRRKGGGRA